MRRTGGARPLRDPLRHRDVGLSTHLDGAGLPDIGGALSHALAGEPVAAPYTLWDMADDAAGLHNQVVPAVVHLGLEDLKSGKFPYPEMAHHLAGEEMLQQALAVGREVRVL